MSSLNIICLIEAKTGFKWLLLLMDYLIMIVFSDSEALEVETEDCFELSIITFRISRASKLGLK